MENNKRACFVKVRDYSTFPIIRMLCFDEGFEDFDIRHVGGLWVMFEFKNREACKNFLASKLLYQWFVEKRKWDRDFMPPERLVWVDVEGLPLRAWSKDAFIKIVAKWGYNCSSRRRPWRRYL